MIKRFARRSLRDEGYDYFKAVKDDVAEDLISRFAGYALRKKKSFIDEAGEIDEAMVRIAVEDIIDEQLYNNDDKWAIMMKYQKPETADYDEAETKFEDDVCEEVINLL